MTDEKPQAGIPLWLWRGFKSWNVYGTPTESGWDATMKGEERCMKNTDWSTHLGGLVSNRRNYFKAKVTQGGRQLFIWSKNKQERMMRISFLFAPFTTKEIT